MCENGGLDALDDHSRDTFVARYAASLRSTAEIGVNKDRTHRSKHTLNGVLRQRGTIRGILHE